jgi:lipoate-protein ligase B
MSLGVRAHRKRHTTAQIGLWIGSKKIASMGIRIARCVTSYGFALNLAGDISPACYIKPCGLDVNLTTVQEQTGMTVDRQLTKEKIQHLFEKTFQRRVGDFAFKVQGIVRELVQNHNEVNSTPRSSN